MKVINLEEIADAKRYGVKSLLKDMAKIHEEKGIELMFIAFKQKNGIVGYGATHGNNAEILGLMEFGKAMYIEDELHGT